MVTYNDNFKVSRIENHVMHSNTFIISYGKEAYLVDVGDLVPVMNTALDIKGVFITHGHHDHLYGINSLMRYFPNCKIYTAETGVWALRSGKRNLSAYSEDEIVEYYGDNIQILHNGDYMELFPNIGLNIYETFGHDDNCLTYRVGNYLFTGDSYIPGVKVVYKLPRGNKQQALQSQKFILSLCNSETVICPGHGEMTVIK